jgi:uncharacterized protein YkwD
MRRFALGALMLALTALASGVGAAALHTPAAPRLAAAPSAAAAAVAAPVAGAAPAPAAPAPAQVAPITGAARAVQRADRLNPPAPIDPRRQIEVRVVELVNAERARAGLNPVAWDERMWSAARAHSDDQAAHQTMSHTGSDGSDMVMRIERTGFRWSRLAENVAAGQTTAESVVAAWMGSSGHRANILNPQLTVVGAGLGISVTSTNYWTLDLGTPG